MRNFVGIGEGIAKRGITYIIIGLIIGPPAIVFLPEIPAEIRIDNPYFLKVTRPGFLWNNDIELVKCKSKYLKQK